MVARITVGTKTNPLWLLIGAVAAICVPAHARAQSASDEYRLKAAFVYRFPQFVEWPSAAVHEARSLDVCVLQPHHHAGVVVVGVIGVKLPAGAVPSYGTSTLRASWQPHPQLEAAIVGQNLHDARHLEWPTGAGGNVLIQRSAHVSVVWRR